MHSNNLPYEKVGDEIHCLSELAPFEIPDSWEWCRVGDLFYNASGLSYKKDLLAKKTDSMVRVLRGGNIGDETYTFKEDDVFISSEYVKPELFLKKKHMITPAVSSIEHIGKIALIDQDYTDVVVGGFVLMLMPYFFDEIISQYLLYAFAAKNHRDNCRNITHKSGQAFYNLSREKLMNLPIPLPPRGEMVRIIRQLKTVLSIVAEYSVKEQAVHKLNVAFPDLLKKSILQEAVQGKLVPQDSTDEPASILLERIRAEKEQLIKTGKIKRDKHESVIFRRDNSHYEKLEGIERCIDDEIPFDIPDSWEWCRLGKLTELITKGSSPKWQGVSYTDKQNGILFVTSENVGVEELLLSKEKYVGSEFNDMHPTSILRKGDLLTNIVGASIGRTAKYTLDISNANINQAVCIIRLVDLEISDYLVKYLNSIIAIEMMTNKSVDSARANLSLTSVSNLLVPVPPLAEQERIVKKLQFVLPLCKNA